MAIFPLVKRALIVHGVNSLCRYALDTSNQPLIRSNELSDSLYDTFEHFGKTKGYNELVGCF